MFKTRHFLTYFSISFFAAAMMWWVWYLYSPQLPPQIPFNFLPSQSELQLINRSILWRYPFYTSAGVIVLTLVAWYIEKKDSFYSQLIISSTSFLAIISLLSLIRVVFLFT